MANDIMTVFATNCSDYPIISGNDSSDSDIAGIGVVIGFVATAYMTLAILATSYIFGYNPKTAGLTGRPNPIDVGILSWTHSKLNWRLSPRWNRVLHKVKSI